ncbi:hypothetical protein FHS89_002383 [Rubricella aquisinus]|uniref:Sulfotransferase family protein n=1 Tax=Rubricella aquisinus TaxID=2028108 RepID=A0A840WRR2_9RHOB|nr:hypothetical protein [Rubricella aquisinus]MBB5516352.1 hypothetical protein [Rubricella aquisinus]
MSRQLIRVFGERNTGTRALAAMIESCGFRTTPGPVMRGAHPDELLLQDRIECCFDGTWRQFYTDLLRDTRAARRGALAQWKHAAPSYDGSFANAGAAAVFTIRNPYSWAVSMLRRPYHIRGPRPETLDELLARPWATVGREGLEPLMPGIMALWVEKVISYRRFARLAEMEGVPSTFIRFEDFVADPVAQATMALTALGHADEQPEPVENTKSDGRSVADIQAYYQQEGWRAALNDEAIRMINDQVPADLMAAYGYERLSPLGAASHGKAGATAAA